MTVIRLQPDFTPSELEAALNDPKRRYFALLQVATGSFVETLFVTYRRLMLGAMQDPSAIIFAIVVTALEEALSRSTMVYRDSFFRKFQGMPDL